MDYFNGGCLSDCLEQYKRKYNKPFSEDIVQHLMRQIVSAIRYIHSKNLMHRSLRLENIKVNLSNTGDLKTDLLKATVKIVDFSMAVVGFGKSILINQENTDPYILKKHQEKLANKASENTFYDIKIDIW